MLKFFGHLRKPELYPLYICLKSPHCYFGKFQLKEWTEAFYVTPSAKFKKSWKTYLYLVWPWLFFTYFFYSLEVPQQLSWGSLVNWRVRKIHLTEVKRLSGRNHSTVYNFNERAVMPRLWIVRKNKPFRNENQMRIAATWQNEERLKTFRGLI